MEKFLNLPAEKQDKIIDAALAAFGANGYKKTSVSDIAAAAGISKAMVFHYFGTKKALYLYLLDLCGDLFMTEINNSFDRRVTDFFDRIMMAARIKIAVMKKYPAIVSFINSAYSETDGEVKEDVETFFTSQKSEEFRTKLVFEGMDASKFKEGVDPKLVMKMLVWFSYGYVNMSPDKIKVDLDMLCQDFEECLNLLRNNLYREEYLKK